MFAHGCPGVINYLPSWLRVCEKGFGYPGFTGGRQSTICRAGCVCCLALLRRMSYSSAKATRKGVCLCFTLFLEDWRAKCCSHLTGKNIAFAYFLCNLWVLIKKWLLFQSVILVQESWLYWRKPKPAQLLFLWRQGAICCLLSLGNAFPSPTSLSLLSPSPTSPIIFQSPWIAASGAAAAAARAVL